MLFIKIILLIFIYSLVASFVAGTIKRKFTEAWKDFTTPSNESVDGEIGFCVFLSIVLWPIIPVGLLCYYAVPPIAKFIWKIFHTLFIIPLQYTFNKAYGNGK